jgi:cell division protein FtsB
MRSVKRAALKIRNSLNSPSRILTYSLLFFVLTLSLNGTPLRLWGLHRDLDRLNKEIIKNHKDIKDLKVKIAQVSQPAYIEREARDRLDLVGEDDLLFVFPTQ